MKQLETPKADNQFADHLAIPNNYRIFVSGQFGSGKTTFLKNFFSAESQETRNDKYRVFHLYPINYQVGDNKDVFEYLKFDLLYALLLDSNDLEFEKLELPHYLTGVDFAFKKVDKILSPFLNFIPSVGRSLNNVFERFFELKKQYQEHRDKLKLDDKEKALEYIKNFPSSLYEDDFYSQLIRQLVKQIKDNGKSTVLILDDLDRIDPDHIFRLLNVFDAHIDIENDENKFGFDNIILVGDIHNIKAIYHQKFGQKADFTGYINKFYSNKVFHFDIRTAIIDGLGSLLDGVEFVYLASRSVLWTNQNNNVISSNIEYIIIALIRSGKLTIREIVEKLTNGYQVPLNNKIEHKLMRTTKRREQKYSFGYAGIVIIEFFCHLFENDIDSLLEAVLDCIDYDLPDTSINHYEFLSLILPLLAYEVHRFQQKSTEKSTLELTNELGKYSITYSQTFYKFGSQLIVTGEITNRETLQYPSLKFNYFDQLMKAIQVCKKNRFVQQ